MIFHVLAKMYRIYSPVRLTFQCRKFVMRLGHETKNFVRGLTTDFKVHVIFRKFSVSTFVPVFKKTIGAQLTYE